jgi:hypothetical protein
METNNNSMSLEEQSVGVLNQIIAWEGSCAGIACYECPLCEAYDCVDVERSTREILEKALEVRNGKK